MVSAYRVPVAGKGISKNTRRRFSETVTDINPNNVLIAGDFNSHHYLWGSARACQNGISFCAALDNSDLISLNNDKSTFVNHPNESSLILDPTFISSHLFTSSSHDVWDDALGSDNYPVVIRLGVQVPVSKYYSHKYSLKEIDWTLFLSVLRNLINSRSSDGLLSAEDPIKNYNTLVECVDEAVLTAQAAI